MDTIHCSTYAPSQPETGVEDSLNRSGGEDGIHCPKCGWSPRSEDRWVCNCHTVWNTFDTGGVCPGCLKQWGVTRCPSCHQWSPHSDWYPKD